jgi:peptidoglycan/xylan/chitin deacetylase (PgdA/CDA1 family)
LIVSAGIARAWRAVARRGVPLIVYFHEIAPKTGPEAVLMHRSLSVDPPLFRWVMSRLAQRFCFATLDQVVDSRDPRLVAVTFDDGYRGVYQHALPILKEFKAPATVFLVTGHIGTDRLLWWDRLLLQARKAQECGPEAAQRLGALEPRILQRDGRISGEGLLHAFKNMSDRQKNEVSRVLNELAGPLASPPEQRFLSEQEIREMSAAGIQFGAHTRTHPLLRWLDDAALVDELGGSKADVGRLTGSEDVWFAYPDGVFGDREMAVVRQVGFRGAVQTWRYPWRRGRYAVPRAGLNAWNLCGGRAQPDPARLEMVLAGLSVHVIRSLWRKDLA